MNIVNMIKICGHMFVNMLNSNSLVIDIGGYIGDFSIPLYDEYKCTIEVYEPDKEIYRKHMENIGSRANYYLYNTAVGIINEERLFYVMSNRGGSSLYKYKDNSSIDSYYTKVIDINNILDIHTKIDLLKLDCEGAEIDILNHCSTDNLLKCTQICVEFHTFMNDKFIDDFEYSKVDEIIKRLSKLNFEPLLIEPSCPEFLFLNRNIIRLND